MRWGLIFAASCSLLAGASRPAVADALHDADVCGSVEKIDVDKRLAACTAFIQAPPKSNEDLYNTLNIRADVWYEKGEFERSIQDYDAAIRLRPKFFIAFINRGTRWAEHGDIDKAMADFDTAIKIDPYIAVTLVKRGDLWEVKGDHVRALADYDAAIHWETHYSSGSNGACFERAVLNKELDRALADCNRAIGLAKAEPEFYDSRAFLHFRRGEFVEAVNDADKALAVEPKWASSLAVRGVSKLRLGKVAEGQADLEQAKVLDPDAVEKYAAWGVKP